MTVTAIEENGAKVRQERVHVSRGVKTVGRVNRVFRADLTRARYFYFACDRKILSFSVNGSADGQMLDGLPSLGEYVRQR